MLQAYSGENEACLVD